MTDEPGIRIDRTVSDLALIALEHGLADRGENAAFKPFLLIESGGHCYIRRLEGPDPAEDAAEFLTKEPDSTSTYALVYDGTVTIEATRFTAVLVIAGQRGAPSAFVFTQRYDAAASPVTLIGDAAFIGQHDALDKAP